MKNFLISFFKHNSFIIFNWYGVCIDLLYYIKAIGMFKRLKKKKYERFTLKTDWIGMGYLVLNYDESFFEDLNASQQDMWIFNDISVLNEDIAKSDLLDSLKNKYKMITIDGDPTTSVEVEYSPYFFYMSFGIILRTIIVYAGVLEFLL